MADLICYPTVTKKKETIRLKRNKKKRFHVNNIYWPQVYCMCVWVYRWAKQIDCPIEQEPITQLSRSPIFLSSTDQSG